MLTKASNIMEKCHKLVNWLGRENVACGHVIPLSNLENVH